MKCQLHFCEKMRHLSYIFKQLDSAEVLAIRYLNETNVLVLGVCSLKREWLRILIIRHRGQPV